MKTGEVTKQVISKSQRFIGMRQLQEVVYKTYLGHHNGKPRWSSKTKHELGVTN